ncbi:AMP-binding protein [Sansalvadorimonas sp. 2012CJ34-2]|uniref:AMP-binding protein n=1 Tax=Parendozoicomonas callyspongiae TaxID=2942213 RepID=A0ABT0PD21_9GAMM|nr:AMP-binding protein [Sansalvadorimonas sp. 2012CJ34-2]MCL6269270.1 AMP-binding protein [Sansalvadorimonas sp. 2012CJ34-2]
MFFDRKEQFRPYERELSLITQLQVSLAHALEHSPFYAKHLAGVDPETIDSREALAKLPVTRKSDLIELQKQVPPFGGLNGQPAGTMGRLFQSPGPIHEPEGKTKDWWRMGRALYAAGFREGDIVHNTLSYHLSPGGFILDSGARACGCAVIPAGVGQTEQQLRVIESLRPNGYAGTPSFLKTLLEKADEQGLDISFMDKALVTGEGLPEALRTEFTKRGIRCVQAYATADAGLIAYESEAQEGMIAAEDIILEIVKPETGDPVQEGEVGEILVTVFNSEYPLFRFATGDLTAVLPGRSPCGRTNMRIRGWMGRADQSTKVKGLFVHPCQISEVVQKHPEINRARLVVESIDSRDSMTLLCEGDAEMDTNAIEATIKIICKLKGKARRVDDGEIVKDGLVIEDLR